MISEAKAFWDAIKGKVKSLVDSETENAMRLQRYDVTTAPDGTVMGVRQPFGNNEIFLPYSQEVASATVDDTVLVAWWGSMSNAKVYYFADGYNGATGDIPQAATEAPEPLGTAAVGSSTKYARQDHVHALPSTIAGGDAGISFQTASIDSNSSVTLHFGSGGNSTVVFATGTASARMATAHLLCTTAGAVHSSVTGSGVTVSQAAANDYKAVITGGSGSRYLLIINYRGNAPEIT